MEVKDKNMLISLKQMKLKMYIENNIKLTTTVLFYGCIRFAIRMYPFCYTVVTGTFGVAKTVNYLSREHQTSFRVRYNYLLYYRFGNLLKYNIFFNYLNIFHSLNVGYC